MKFSNLPNHQSLPRLMTSVESDDLSLPTLIRWLSSHREQIDRQIYQAGALLIRGFPVTSATLFREVCAALCADLRDYTGGDSPRTVVTDKVYTSTEYAAELEVLLHNELSYAGWMPERVFFGCLHPAASGGETHLADGRNIYRSLDKAVRSRFEELGVTYLQYLWDEEEQPGPGKSWQQTFETSDRSEVENYLRRSDMDFEWTNIGIRTAATKAAVQVHPVTAEKCWHNQADQWHRGMLSVKDSVAGEGAEGDCLNESRGTESLGNHVSFGDGSEIEVADLEHIREISRQCEVVYPWQQGDVLVIDNILSMHGRKPFSGKRQVVVAMA
jgi:alpha-ketoglutarate-dependent taurine dioxygenase